MAIEIERKFLLANEAWRAGVHASKRIAQAYLNDTDALASGREHCSVRVRISGGSANININGNWALRARSSSTRYRCRMPNS